MQAYFLVVSSSVLPLQRAAATWCSGRNCSQIVHCLPAAGERSQTRPAEAVPGRQLTRRRFCRPYRAVNRDAWLRLLVPDDGWFSAVFARCCSEVHVCSIVSSTFRACLRENAVLQQDRANGRSLCSNARPTTAPLATRATAFEGPVGVVDGRRMDFSLGAPARGFVFAVGSGVRQLFEGIEDSEAGPTEILIVAGNDRESVPPGRRCNVAVLDRHSVTGLFEEAFLLRPDIRHRNVEPVDASVHRIDETRQPGLERLPLSPFFRASPVGELSNDDRARVASVLFLLQPRYDSRIASTLRRLADDIRIEQPVHKLRRRADSRRRGGTSSMLTGHSLRTASQSSLPARRRNTMASSSASKRASKYSPGDVDANEAGTVKRRFESSVTIMVGLSHSMGDAVKHPVVSPCDLEAFVHVERFVRRQDWDVFHESLRDDVPVEGIGMMRGQIEQPEGMLCRIRQDPPVRLEFVVRRRLGAGRGPWQWETQRTWLRSARATVCPPTKVAGVWPSNDAWQRAALYNSTTQHTQYRVSGSPVPMASVVRSDGDSVRGADQRRTSRLLVRVRRSAQWPIAGSADLDV